MDDFIEAYIRTFCGSNKAKGKKSGEKEQACERVSSTQQGRKVKFRPRIQVAIENGFIGSCYIEELITDVKFSYSERTGKITTIVWFSDGDKVTTTPADGDIFKKEKGIEQCIMKKLFGNRSRLKKFYKKWCG